MNLARLAERDLAERGARQRLWFEERYFSNLELHERSLRLSGTLSALGVGLDDRVMLVLPSCPEVLVSMPAIWRVGAVVVPVPELLEVDELAHVADSSGAKLVITSLELLGKLRRALERLRAGARLDASRLLVVTEGKAEPAPPSLSFERALAHSAPYGDAVARAEHELAAILPTSGTTSLPRGVMLSHGNLLTSAEGPASGGPRDQVSILALPLSGSSGLEALLQGYRHGGRAVLMRRFTASDALVLIERHRATSMAGLPAMFLQMLRVEEPYETSTMQLWRVLDAAPPRADVEAFERRFGGHMRVEYRVAEASAALASERTDEPRKPGSVGRPLAGVRVKIVDVAGHEVGPGEVGEICAAGDIIANGYDGRPDASAESFRGPWLHTGDIGVLDEDGYLFVHERKRDLIVRGGLNVYPRDVEEALLRHPDVAECAVIGVPDPLLGEQVCACVVVCKGAEVRAEQLIAHCQAQLASYKSPRYVELVSTLPRTWRGKVKKHELRARMARRLSVHG